ncbi:TIGR01777 family oxidoreductase [Microbacterium sp. ARD31]|uniref:TIGR01777 family oxidoreductase n=1 Tax=Microbacterium sp. ARD31 TaxID=2962576 RepID=UPI0028816CEE|nr:TIGR01777 family oxidoreductase [Microbacterium sp. ARD31]MDT0186808.1 TIGR01777 family oxidoreductase [Microbacterium sp. ARD31]
MKVVVAGGSGALGRRLCADLAAAGHEVVVLTRRPRPGPHRQVGWDGRTLGPWGEELAGSAVVNLAGELVDRRPTAANIELLTTSRVEPTQALVEASRTLGSPVPVWVQASTLAIYGDAGDVVLDESAPPAAGPPQMAGVARAWEAAVEGANAGRLVVLRTGIVLDNDTPALDRLWSLARWGLGGRVGPGTQWVSWTHVDDWLAIVRTILEPESPLSGVLHATGPEPARNADLMAALRRSLGRPAAPPTPAALVRIGAMLLRTDPALALTGRRAVPARLLENGFRFAHPELDEALADLRDRQSAGA